MKKKKTWIILSILMPIVYLLVAVAVSVLVYNSGVYPRGSDTMYHVYRGDFVYHSILEGNWYPQYNAMWYNGVELMRYWAPLAAYFMALCQAVAGGNLMNGYLVFVGMICFLGALPWLYIGIKKDRPWLGSFIGLLWFFMPNNLCAMFVEGNLARSLCMVFLPLFIYSVCEYLQKPSWGYLPLMTISFSLMILCHLGYAGMIALAVLLYSVVFLIGKGKLRNVLEVIASIIFGFMILGVWLVASLNGGITSMDTSENMANFFQSAWTSLNPLERIASNNSNFYFGIAAFILAVTGIIISYKKSIIGFWTGIIIMLCTTTAMYPVMKILPGSQYLWMLRFISIALCIILYSFIMWDTLKKPLIAVFCVLLAADTIPSLSLIYGEQNKVTVQERFNFQQEITLIEKAQKITKQRLALMDESSMGATGAFLVSDWNNGVAGCFGAGWEAANTSKNIVQLNRAVSSEKYYYLFDRCLELGNDSVIIQLSCLKKYTGYIDDLDKAASASGYELVESNSAYRLYHMYQDGNWGTITKYNAIGIGSAVETTAMTFPAMEEADSYNLNDYTYEQLKQYDVVFLAGFTYDDREAAENLILQLSESGVKIVIGADGIPQDKKTHAQSFLGVTCNAITFTNGYPELDTKEGILYTDMFPQGLTTWQTVYLEGLDESWGKLYDNGFQLDFYGTVKNENIVMIGLNLNYFYGVTNDKSVGRLLGNVFGLSGNQLPDRKIVPLTVEYNKNQITITSKEDNVNTTIAYHDIFKSDKMIKKLRNLMYVDKGTTIINMEYPYLIQGILLNIAGVVLMVVWLIKMKKRLNETEEQEYKEKDLSNKKQNIE